MLRFALAGIVAVFAFVPIMAHDFDVSSQKGELQIVLPVSGNKVSHKGNNINPIPQQYPATVNHGAGNAATPHSIIPYPETVDMKEGCFTMPENASFHVEGQSSARFVEYLHSIPLGLFATTDRKTADIDIVLNDKSIANNEAYKLEIRRNRITIKASGETGAFYAIQSLMQMTENGANRQLQCCFVYDSPRFPYRGLHFDVSRHFRSKEFLMKQMDAMALLKMNNMHLHLTNGAGWRIEIERYPRLTEFAAWRPQKKWMEWSQAGARYCERTAPYAYGGYYTKGDIAEILEYASSRHITVIPDIEMPGHSEEVLAAYPQLSCSGKASANSDYCIGKDETFQFIENVLAEIIELFPSEYIHIGGDEAVKNAWKDCPDCQKRMNEEGLASVDELQSYFIHRIERFVNAKGRKIIGFDEILQGGLAPNATVMSWRGTQGGIKAIKSGHDVIMCPVEYYYLDYSQDAPFKEPVSIGGYTPLRTVYSYEPLDPAITTAEARHLIGVQGNLWSEYITEDNHAEYMYYPRAFAIAETGWSKPENKNYDDFHARALNLCNMLDKMGYATFRLSGEFGERKESLAPIMHLGRGRKVVYNIPYSTQWPGTGDATLTDGILGGWTYRDMKWQGTMSDLDVTIDLGKVQPIKYVGATFMHSEGAWVHVPKKLEIFLSVDGTNYKQVGEVWGDVSAEYPKLLFKLYSVVCDDDARYVRIHATKNERPGAWLFTDEIIIN